MIWFELRRELKRALQQVEMYRARSEERGAEILAAEKAVERYIPKKLRAYLSGDVFDLEATVELLNEAHAEESRLKLLKSDLEKIKELKL